jgi:putative ABC transport system permease protein
LFLKEALYAGRRLRREAGFAITAILTLAVGIGGNTAMFTLVRAIVLRPLNYHDPDRLIQISLDDPRGLTTFTPVRYRELKAHTRSFRDLGAFGLPENMMLTIGAQSEQVSAARVSANILRVLGIRPLLGRDFHEEDDAPGGNRAAMISREFWRTRFGADSSVAGKAMVLDSQLYTIIGVMPARFEFPFAGIDVWVTRPAEWTGVSQQDWDRTASLTGFARLRNGITLQQAAAELAVLNRQYVAANPALPDAKSESAMRVERLADVLAAPVRGPLEILFGAAAFVLLIACANLAGLMLARAASRRREFAIRSALGAGRGRLAMQSLAESMLLSLTGAALGLGVAEAITLGMTRQTAFPLPRTGEIRLDAWVLLLTLIVTGLTGVLLGVLPSARVAQPELAEALREHGATGTPSRRVWGRIRGRDLLVVCQVALSVVLLIGTAMLIKSFARLQRVDLGFRPANILTMRITLPPARYNSGQKITAFFDDLVERVQALPGVRYAAVARSLPTLPYGLIALQAAEQPQIPYAQRPIGALQTISADYFRLMGISLRAGRLFTEQDLKGGRPVLIVNEALAKRFWPGYPSGRAPVGQHLQLGKSAYPVEMVGIVGDVHEGGPAYPVRPEVYLPARFSPPRTAYLMIRSDRNPSLLVSAVRKQVSAIDREETTASVKTVDELIDSALGDRRLTMMLLGAFAAVALLLAAIGLYGLIAYSVARRTGDIGIRRALGAQRLDILRLIVGQGIGLALGGVVLGLGGAAALTRFMRTLLFEVSGTDPGIFAGIALLLFLVALAASGLPARRATQIDPVRALRSL